MPTKLSQGLDQSWFQPQNSPWTTSFQCVDFFRIRFVSIPDRSPNLASVFPHRIICDRILSDRRFPILVLFGDRGMRSPCDDKDAGVFLDGRTGSSFALPTILREHLD